MNIGKYVELYSENLRLKNLNTNMPKEKIIPTYISLADIKNHSGVCYASVLRYNGGERLKVSTQKKIVDAISQLMKDYNQLQETKSQIKEKTNEK